VAAALGQPKHLHPKYSDFVYRVVLGALPLRAQLHRFMDIPATCVFCNEPETYEHLFLDCIYLQDTWKTLDPFTAALGLVRPTSLSGLLFDEPEVDTRHSTLALAVWPILRASVWFQVWTERNDRIFRPDHAAVDAQGKGMHAAFVLRVHLRHLVDTDGTEEQTIYSSLVHLRHNDWILANILPHQLVTA